MEPMTGELECIVIEICLWKWWNSNWTKAKPEKAEKYALLTYNNSTCTSEPFSMLIIFQVWGLVRINEDEIERLRGIQLFKCIDSTAHNDVHFVGKSSCFYIFGCNLDRLTRVHKYIGPVQALTIGGNTFAWCSSNSNVVTSPSSGRARANQIVEYLEYDIMKLIW